MDLFRESQRLKSWVDPGQPSTSTPKPNRFGKKTMLCVWWDQQGIIYFELLKPGETVNTDRYHQQLIKLHRAIRKKGQNLRKDMTARFSSMTMHQHTRHH